MISLPRKMQLTLQKCKQLKLLGFLMNWDDIKIFLEVARAERLSVAARRMAVDASTISRRLHQLEEQLSTQLFKRTTQGHVLTSDGEKLLETARRMEQDAMFAFDHIKGESDINAGLVRIGVTEAFGNQFIAPNLFNLSSKHPDIQIDLLHFSRDVKISRNEADIAIAIEKPKSTSMIVSKLSDYKLQIYGAKNSMHQRNISSIRDLSTKPWVSYVDKLLFTEQLSYLEELNMPINPVLRSTSIISQLSAIQSGIGIGVLPCFLADNDPNLVKILPEEITIIRSFWLITHPEIKRLTRVNTVWEYLKQLAKSQQSKLMP